MGTTITETPVRYSRRVQAWVYAVLNPLIESMRRELFLLGKGNLSWRSYSRRCEYIRPVVEDLDGRHLPVLEDFLAEAENAGFVPRFQGHDAKLAAVESAASEAYEWLMRSDAFRNQVQRSLPEYEARVSASLPGYDQSLRASADSLPAYIAGYLINGVTGLPYHYATHKFWEDYRTQFQHYRKERVFHDVSRTATALEQLSKALVAELGEHRLSLCRHYDIPAAPLIALAHRDEDLGGS